MVIQRLKAAGNSTACHLERLKAKLAALVGSFQPDCLSLGGFAPRQCWGSTGECWCEDPSGRETQFGRSD
eukprot:g5012.t1